VSVELAERCIDPSEALAPGSLVGILGGGQLGRMMAMAAARLGFHTRIYCERYDAPSFDVSGEFVCAGFDDTEALVRFSAGLDVATYEFENIPLEALEVVGGAAPVRPGPRALAVTQDRLAERRFLDGLGIAVAGYRSVETFGDLEQAAGEIGYPAHLKARRLGYDGKGQARITGPSGLGEAWRAIGGVPAILEAGVAFAREVSIIAARALDGTVVFYDLAENSHADGILQRSRVPATVPAEIGDMARDIGQKVMSALDYVGTIAVELFHLEGEAPGPLVVNEIAPRVHNSGHWTLDAAMVDQFENHIRAIAGWPLGDTGRLRNAEMINLIGDDIERWRDYAGKDRHALHLYGKRETRAGRKMGHVTLLDPADGGGPGRERR